MKAFGYKVFLIFCAAAFGLAVIAILRVVAVPGIIALLVDWRQEQKIVDLNKLRDLGELQTVPLSQVINKPVELVCVLGVYQLRLRDDGPFRDRISALLKSGDFGFFGKSTWFFVLVFGDSATVQSINAHRDQLHLTTDDADLPSTFKQVECATVDRARIIKVRKSVISLGEER